MEVTLVRRMYDSISVASLPTDGDLYAGYVNGNWPTYPTVVARFPNALHVSIAVTADHDAQVLDVERGDATPKQAVGWVQRQRTQGRIPTVYANTSTWPQVIAAFHSAGLALPQWWEARYDFNPVLSPGSIAKQYSGGNAYDISVVADYWPGIDPPPAPPARKETTMLVARFVPSGAEYLQTETGLTYLADDASVQAYKKVLPFVDGLPDSLAQMLPGHI